MPYSLDHLLFFYYSNSDVFVVLLIVLVLDFAGIFFLPPALSQRSDNTTPILSLSGWLFFFPNTCRRTSFVLVDV